jgi:phospholipase C
MVRLKIVLLLRVVMGTAALLINLNGCGAVSSSNNPPPPPPPGKIKHIVIIFQENRTPDNLFHDPVLISRGADIASSGQISNGRTIPLTPVSLVTPYDLDHGHRSFLKAWNNGLMNGADQIPCYFNCRLPYPQYQYVRASDVQPYFIMAETYTFGDRMFQTNQGPSFSAHQYMISGTSAISEKSLFDVADNPMHAQHLSGCIAPPGTLVQLIDTRDPNPDTNQTQTAYPCFERPSLTDLLDAKRINWKYYTPAPGSIWTAPDAIRHMCGPNVQPPKATACTAAEWINHVVVEGQNNQILNDIAAGQLADVSWVIPNGSASDHPNNPVDVGPSWVASIVNAIGTSGYWADTAIIITWDDWGGWYDHVPPPAIHNSYEYGLRVPLIVVSTFAKPAHISHQTYDFGSILKFIETTFSLPEIDPAVHYADARAIDLSGDCFNFNQKPLPFTPIPAPQDANYFLNDKSPPTPPDDD